MKKKCKLYIIILIINYLNKKTVKYSYFSNSKIPYKRQIIFINVILHAKYINFKLSHKLFLKTDLLKIKR